MPALSSILRASIAAMKLRALVFLLLPLAALAQTNLYPMQEGFIDSHGALIYYKTMGRGTPLFLVHGGPAASHDYFLPHLLPLMRNHRLIFIDERGSGRSSKFQDPAQYTVANMVEDIEVVRETLGLGKISLFGHSFGGVLAEAYAFK